MRLSRTKKLNMKKAYGFGEQEKEEQDPFLQAQEGMYAVKNTIDNHPSAPKNIYKTPFLSI